MTASVKKKTLIKNMQEVKYGQVLVWSEMNASFGVFVSVSRSMPIPRRLKLGYCLQFIPLVTTTTKRLWGICEAKVWSAYPNMLLNNNLYNIYLFNLNQLNAMYLELSYLYLCDWTY